jgi:hypothetical protein
VEALDTEPDRSVVQQVVSSSKNGLASRMNLDEITILRIATHFPTLKARTGNAIFPSMDTFTTTVKAQPFNEPFTMVMWAELQNVTDIINSVAVKRHFSTRHATVNQSKPTFLSKNRLRQIAVSKSRRDRNVLNFAETTPNPLFQATSDALCPANTPSANEADRTKRGVAPQMVVSTNYFVRTIHTIN